MKSHSQASTSATCISHCVRTPRRTLFALTLLGTGLLAGAVSAAAQTDSASEPVPPQSSTSDQPSATRARPTTDQFPSATAKLALAPIATYDNRYEIFGGVGFQNFQAGQNLPKRMNFATAEAQGTYWLGSHLGATGSYRFAGGTTPVLPNNRYNRVAIFQNDLLGGATWRGPKGRYAAIDYHGLAGVSIGKFDSAFSPQNGAASITPALVGLYPNHSAFMAALGGSVDFNYTKNLGIRLQPDLILERYGTELREFVAVSGGIMYRFGKR